MFKSDWQPPITDKVKPIHLDSRGLFGNHLDPQTARRPHSDYTSKVARVVTHIYAETRRRPHGHESSGCPLVRIQRDKSWDIFAFGRIVPCL